MEEEAAAAEVEDCCCVPQRQLVGDEEGKSAAQQHQVVVVVEMMEEQAHQCCCVDTICYCLVSCLHLALVAADSFVDGNEVDLAGYHFFVQFEEEGVVEARDLHFDLGDPCLVEDADAGPSYVVAAALEEGHQICGDWVEEGPVPVAFASPDRLFLDDPS